MAETSGMALIRGIDIDKFAKGFADEANVFKSFVSQFKTKSREIRWYKKTSGFLDSTTTTGMTSAQMENVAERARPVVIEQSWTRQTSYVRKYFVESPTISNEDIKDSDIDILGGNVRDIVRAVQRKVDKRIFDILTESQTPVDINTAAASGTGWDDATNGNPIKDLLVAKRNIRQNGYNPQGATVAMDALAEQQLITYLIDTKGSSIPSFSSEKVKSGIVMEILGLNVVVSENVVTDYVAVFVPGRACTWKSFMPLKSVVMDEPGIGKKIRCWEEGEAILTDPKAVHLITDTTT